jgi:hypothetical protein
MSLPQGYIDLSQCSEREQMQLAEFVYARRPHEKALNLMQIRMLIGPPLPAAPSVKEEVIDKFKSHYHMCNGMHKKYQW